MEKVVKILMTEFVTHDVKRFVLEKPKNFKYIPGQATYLSINQSGWKDRKNEFTFTSLNDALVLEFTIKGYPDHHGVTEKLHSLVPGDEVIIRDPFGTINYKGNGTFIAGGAGITPFIAIFRQLKKEGKIAGNNLFFSNKTWEDIILEMELRSMFEGNALTLTLTQEQKQGYENKRIDKEFLKEKITDFSQNFYICGPKPMIAAIQDSLKELGAKSEALIFEK